MGVDFASNIERQLDGAIDEFVSFQFHLAACYIERGNDLEVGGGGSVGEDRFMELLLHGVVILIFNKDHGTLAQTGHGFVSGIGLINAQTNFVGIGEEASAKQCFLVGLQIGS